MFAGNASRADDVSTVFNNPAGMSELQGTQLEVGGALVLPEIGFSGDLTAGRLRFPETITARMDRSLCSLTSMV